jgi:hypothetical protein
MAMSPEGDSSIDLRSQPRGHDRPGYLAPTPFSRFCFAGMCSCCYPSDFIEAQIGYCAEQGTSQTGKVRSCNEDRTLD